MNPALFTTDLFRNAGARISRFSALPNERVRGHGHPTAHLFMLVNGELEQGVGPGARMLKAGEARLSGADAIHNIDVSSAGAECLVVHFRQPRIRGSRFCTSESHKDVVSAMMLALECDDTQAPRAYLSFRRALAGFGETQVMPDWLEESWQRLTASGAIPHKVSDVAQSLCVSREHLARRFRAQFGVSPVAARLLARTSRAARLVREGAPIAEAAAEAGFTDQSHLNRAFRHTFGCTPLTFRDGGSHLSNTDAVAARL